MSARTTSDQVLRVFIGLFAVAVVGGAAAGLYRFAQYIRHPPGGFGCRSMQSEPRTNLHGLWTAEKAFYGEYGTYTTDLVSLNWFPDGSPRYLYGFAHPGGPAKIQELVLDPTRSNTADPRVAADAEKTGEPYSIRHMEDLAGNPLTASELPANAVATSNGFVAAAVGDIEPQDTVQLDVWTIDQKGTELVVTNDCIR